VALLSFSTLRIAWTGFEAAQRGVTELHHYPEADSALSLANCANTKAGQDGIREELNFDRWLDASTNGPKNSPRAAGVASARRSSPGSTHG
jgi:hypothetical protein